MSLSGDTISTGELEKSSPGNFQENGGKITRSPSPSLADVDTERAVIAALMIDPSAISSAATILGGLMAAVPNPAEKKGKGPKDIDSLNRDFFTRVAESVFYDRKYAAIYAAILEMNENKRQRKYAYT